MVLVVLASLGLAAPAAAPAADADVQAAWTSEDRALKTQSRALAGALKKAERARFRRAAGPVVTAIRQLERLTAAVRAKVTAARSSTVNGAAAREAVLNSLRGFASSLKSLRGAIQAAARGRLVAAQRLLRRSQASADRADDDAADARIFFDAARREAADPPPPPPPPPGEQPPPSGGGGTGGGDPGGGGTGSGEQPPPPPPEQPPSEDPCATVPFPPECVGVFPP